MNGPKPLRASACPGAATVIASDKMPARLAISRHFGVDVPVEAGDKAYQAVMDHTGGEGVDYLVEAVGNRFRCTGMNGGRSVV